jgi:hypothetical protein
MKIELELNNEQEIDELYHQISHQRSRLNNERDDDIKMIKLLEGNESNWWAKLELDRHIHSKEFYDEKIAILDAVLKQLEPYATLRYII